MERLFLVAPAKTITLKITKQNITIIGLAVGLGLVLIFFGLEKLTQATQEQVDEAFQQGYEQGAVDFVSTLFQQTEDCRITPIFLNNFTRSVVDVDCIQRIPEQP